MLKATRPRFLKTKLPHQDFAEKILSKYRFFRRDFLGGASLIFRKKVNSKAKYDAPLHRFMLNIRWQFPGLTDEGPSISGAKSLTFTQQPLYIFQKQYLQQIEDRHFNNKTGPEHIITRVLRSARPLTLKRMDLKASDEAVQLPGRERTVSEAIDLTIKTGLSGKTGLIQSQSTGAGLLQKTAGLIKVYPAGLLQVYRAGLIQSLPAGLIQAYSAGLIQAYQAGLLLGQPNGTGLRAYSQVMPFMQLYLRQAGRRAAGRREQAGQAIPEAAGEVFARGSLEKTIRERMGGLSQVLQAELQNLWSNIFTYSALTQASRIPAKERQETNGPFSAPESRTIEKTGVTGKDQLIKLSAEISRQSLLREKAVFTQAAQRGKTKKKAGTQGTFPRQALFSREISVPLEHLIFSKEKRIPLQHSIFSREISVLLRYLAFSSLHREPGFQGLALKHSFSSSKRILLLSNLRIQKSMSPQRPVFSSKAEVSGKESGIRELSPRQALITKTDLSVKAGLSGKADLVQTQSTRTGLIQSLPAGLIQAYSAGLIQAYQTGLIQVYQVGLIQGQPTGTELSAYGPVRPFMQLYLGQAGRRAAGRRVQAGQAIPEAAGRISTSLSAEKTILERMGGLSQVLQTKLQNLWSSIYIYGALTQISCGPAKDRQSYYSPLIDKDGRAIEKTGMKGKEQLIQLTAEISWQALLRERAFLAQAGKRGKQIRKSGTQEIFSRQWLLSKETSAPLQNSIFNREISVLLQYSAFNNLSRELAIKEIALKHSFSSSKRIFLLSNLRIQKSMFPQRPVFSGKTEVSGKESGVREMSPRQDLITKTDLLVKPGLPGKAGLVQTQSTRAGLLQKTAGLIQVYPAGLIQGQPTGTGLSAYGPVRPFMQLYLGQAGRRTAGRRGQAGQAIPEAAGEVFIRGTVEKTISDRISQPGEILQANLQNLWNSIFTYSALTKASRRPAKDRQRPYGPLFSEPDGQAIEKTGATGKDQLIQLSAEISRQSLLREKAVFAQSGKLMKKSGSQELFSWHPLFTRETSAPLQHLIFSRGISVPRQYLALSSFLRESGIQEIALKHFFANNKSSIRHYFPDPVQKTIRERISGFSQVLQAKLQNLWSGIYTYSVPADVSRRIAGDRLKPLDHHLSDPGIRATGKTGIAGDQLVQLFSVRNRLALLSEKTISAQVGRSRKPVRKSVILKITFLQQPFPSRKIAGQAIQKTARDVPNRHYFPGPAEKMIREGIGGLGEILQAKLKNLWSSAYSMSAGVNRRLAGDNQSRSGLPDNLNKTAVKKRSTSGTGQQVFQRSDEISQRLKVLRETVETERRHRTVVEDLNLNQLISKTRISETTRMDFLKTRTAKGDSAQNDSFSKTPAQTEINIERVSVPASQEANIDINKIVDKVYIEIERKIKSERQRRGL